jgi:hypothetical protein
MVTVREGKNLNKIKTSGNQSLIKMTSMRNGKIRSARRINYCMAIVA